MSSRFPFSFLLLFLVLFFFHSLESRLERLVNILFFEDEKLRNNPHIYSSPDRLPPRQPCLNAISRAMENFRDE